MNTIVRISEDKLAFDHDRAFKVRAKGVKLLGLWAAEKMGLKDDGAQAYARALVATDFDEPGDDDILGKLQADLAPYGIGRAELTDRLIAFVEQASTE